MNKNGFEIKSFQVNVCFLEKIEDFTLILLKILFFWTFFSTTRFHHYEYDFKKSSVNIFFNKFLVVVVEYTQFIVFVAVAYLIGWI